MAIGQKGKTRSLQTGEVKLTESNVELGKTVLGVSLRDGVEHDGVVQDVVVEGEVTAERQQQSVFAKSSKPPIALTQGSSRHPCP